MSDPAQYRQTSKQCPAMCPSLPNSFVYAFIVASLSVCPSSCWLHRVANFGVDGGTDLEDIGDGDSVLGDLALGGDDGDGWPRHGGCCELTWMVSCRKREVVVGFLRCSEASEFGVGALYRIGAWRVLG